MTIQSLNAAVHKLKRKHGLNPSRNPSIALPQANTTTIAVVLEAFLGKKLLTRKHKTAEIRLTSSQRRTTHMSTVTTTILTGITTTETSPMGALITDTENQGIAQRRGTASRTTMNATNSAVVINQGTNIVTKMGK